MKKIAVVGMGGKHLKLMIPLARLLKIQNIELIFFFPLPQDIPILIANDQSFISLKNTNQNPNVKNLSEATRLAQQRMPLVESSKKRKAEAWLIKKLTIHATFIEEYLKTNLINMAIIWNGAFDIDGIARHVFSTQKIPLIICENGFLNHTLQVDSQGVNSRSSFQYKIDKKESATQRNFSLPSADLTIRKPSKLRFLTGTLQSFLQSYSLRFTPSISIKTFLIQPFYNRYLLKKDKIILPEKYIFFPFQVFDDTQILFNSSNFRSMETVLEKIYPIIRDNFSDYSLIIKEHPADLVRKNYQNIRKKYPEIVWLRKYPLDILLNNSNCIITVNSSVGIEALTHHKPVIVLGEAIYALSGISLLAATQEDIKSKLEIALQDNPDFKKIDHFLEMLREQVLLDCDWRRSDQKDVQTFANYILNRMI